MHHSAAAPESEARWQHFPHDADVGVRGGATSARAFEQAAYACIIVQRSAPACEPKGATYTALRVAKKCATARAVRHATLKRWSGRKIIDDLASRGILSRSPSTRGVAEETPGAYKDVGAVVAAAEHADLARRIARLRPLICIKG
jgi:hypothetical protein